MYHSFSNNNDTNRGADFGVFTIIYPNTGTNSSNVTNISDTNFPSSDSLDQQASKAHFIFVRGALNISKGLLI